jgi:hypothetical protein
VPRDLETVATPIANKLTDTTYREQNHTFVPTCNKEREFRSVNLSEILHDNGSVHRAFGLASDASLRPTAMGSDGVLRDWPNGRGTKPAKALATCRCDASGSDW